MLTRREVLRTGAIGAPAILLVGCNGLTANQAIGQAAQDAATIAAGLKGSLTSLAALNIQGLTPDKLQAVGLAVAGIQTVATALSMASSSSQARPLVQQLEADLNAVVDTLAGLPLPPQISLPLQAAAILLPVIETAVGMAVTQLNPPAAAVAMTADQARAILIGAAH